jgi:hypothetical protein
MLGVDVIAFIMARPQDSICAAKLNGGAHCTAGTHWNLALPMSTARFLETLDYPVYFFNHFLKIYAAPSFRALPAATLHRTNSFRSR